MTNRERVLCAINRKTPDRVPLDFGAAKSCKISLVLYKKLLEHFGIVEENIRVNKFIGTVNASDTMFEKLECDVRAVNPAFERKGPPDPEWEDEKYLYQQDPWGTVWCKPKGHGLYYDMCKWPLEGTDEEADKTYTLPEISIIKAEAAQQAETYKKAGYPVVLAETFANGFLDTGPRVYNFADWLSILAGEEERAVAFMDKLLERKYQYWKMIGEVFGTSLDVVCETDDLGTQNGPYISPKMFRNLIKPYYKELYPYIKKVTGAKLFLHSCGSITEFIPDLIEVGVDIISPVQISAENMDPVMLKREFGKDICFWGGGIDTQFTLSHAAPQQVRDEVKRNIEAFSKDGGYVFASVHNIQPNVPLENFLAMWETFKEFRG